VSPYDGLIRRAAARHELDPALVGAVVKQESGFRSTAVSSAGAMGLMQLMPDTARELGVADPFDASQNIEGGTRLLRTLLDRYGGRVDYALAAFNAGPAAVDRYGGVPPFAETKAYVRDVMANYRNSALNA
jgi:soluble lytic murein transglycosylase-like protein